jgi:hypothetical protein
MIKQKDLEVNMEDIKDKLDAYDMLIWETMRSVMDLRRCSEEGYPPSKKDLKDLNVELREASKWITSLTG